MNPWEKTESFEGKVKVYYDNLLDHFKRFKNNVFVESGTFIGNGLNCALQAGFIECHSIEIHEHLYLKAQQRFGSQIKKGKVKLYHGDSSVILKQLIDSLDKKTTFWLDAHISSNYGEKLSKNCPILEELEYIKNNHIKNHTIMIDDLNCFGKEAHDYISLEQVLNKIKEINNDYKFEYLDAAISKNILVAYV